MAFTMPRSPTGRTSGSCKRNIRNISADQRPMPLTRVSWALMTSSSSSAAIVIEIELALLDKTREIPQIANLLTAVADAAELLVRDRREAVRGWACCQG